MGARRSSNNKLILGLIIAILVILIFFVPSYGWELRGVLSPSIRSSGVGQADSPSTISENMALKAQIAQFQIIQSQLPASPAANYVRGMVYSRYPFNFKNEILVNVGSDNGIQIGAAALFQGVLIGQVQKVFPNYSVVQTVFDNGLKMPVRVGSQGTDGLLQGSAYPTVGSIGKSSAASIGDVVYSAAPGLPYGLPIGTISATSTSADSLFQQATINFSYDINSIQTVFITQ